MFGSKRLDNLRGTVAVIGAGWYGVHTALHLRQVGYEVTIFEKNNEIFSEISGEYGIRLHVGPHYPRCKATRHTCHRGYKKFRETYPELCIDHYRAVYGLGKIDADGQPSKVGPEEFRNVCQEYGLKEQLDLIQFGFKPDTVHAAYDMDEPSTVLGSRLRRYFDGKLAESLVSVRHGVEVKAVYPAKGSIKGFAVHMTDSTNPGVTEMTNFDYIVNATSFINFAGEERMLPFNVKTVYQPCLALMFQDIFPREQPVSVIIMDGWFPCLMPHDDRPSTETPIDKYIMLHGKYTITSSYDTPGEAEEALALFNDETIREKVAIPTADHMTKFWPAFAHRFQYTGWKGTVLAKVRSGSEFRSAVAFQSPDGLISIFPGKINNIFDAAREVELLMTGAAKTLCDEDGNRIIAKGTLHEGLRGIKQAEEDKRSTSRLQTLRNVIDQLRAKKAQAQRGARRMSQSIQAIPRKFSMRVSESNDQ